MSAFAKPLILYQNMNVLVDIRNSSNTPMIPTTKQNGLACVGSVSVANFDVLAARKLGREQKKRKKGEGERREGFLLSSPPPLKHRNLPRKRLLRRLRMGGRH